MDNRVLMRITLSLVLTLIVVGCSRGPNLSAKVDGDRLDALAAGAEYHKGRLHILGGLGPSMDAMIYIYVKASGPGVYPLNSEEYAAGNYGGYTLNEKKSSSNFLSNRESVGAVEITKFDTLSRRVSGNFEFDAVQIIPEEMKFGTRVVHVTAGRFRDVPIRDTLQLNLTE